MKHYSKTPIEHWDFMAGYSEAIKNTEYFKYIWFLGNITKYAFRAPFKGQFKEDIQKVIVYAQKVIITLEQEEIVTSEDDRQLHTKLFIQ